MKNLTLLFTLLLVSASLHAQEAKPNVEDTLQDKQRLQSFFEQHIASKSKSETQLRDLVSVTDSLLVNTLTIPKIREMDLCI